MRIVINRSGEQFYFELQSDGNYETLATSERYVRRSNLDAAVRTIIAEAGSAQVVDNT